ncbi:spore germination protein [Paenibacillus sp. CECT 9249]|uniref:spore germination protein n=1 Tax=Paenibacillus sp. CECT 9249 TaxID=2845385 RepID=UPI001E516A51|nr:spore germination protein [Paenibacillus sp. CECT 9249]
MTEVADTLQQFKEAMQGISDVVYHEVELQGGAACVLIYIPSITDSNKLQDSALTPLIKAAQQQSAVELNQSISNGNVFPMIIEQSASVAEAVTCVLEGKTACHIRGLSDIFILPLTKYQKRSIAEAQNEMVIVGPQVAFIEDLDSNISLIRHLVKHPDFKIQHYKIGKYSNSDICLFYIDGLVNQEVLSGLKEKLEGIKMDGVLGVSYIVEQIESTTYTPFPLVQYTERPDTVVSSLMEGRVGLLVEGTPSAVIVPVTFFSLMQAAEDYFQRFFATTWIRWIRYLFIFVSFLLPSLYIAVTTFHPEMIPSNLLITIASSREHIPFPALVEAFMMEITFEGLREAGIRIPKPIGQTVSIIGGIVIGQAAVQAGIISAPMVIVVALTGIASFITPNFELALAFRLLRFPIMILAGTFGMLGIILGLFLIICHMVSLQSFGIPYMSPLAPIVLKDWKDTFVRAPWKKMIDRPGTYENRDERRQDTHIKKDKDKIV